MSLFVQDQVPVPKDLTDYAITMSHVARYPLNEASWDLHRETITQLYYRDGLSLNRVMETMTKEYGFKATVKMYKTRVKAWRLAKYNKGGQTPRRRRVPRSTSSLGTVVHARGGRVWSSVSSELAETTLFKTQDEAVSVLSVPADNPFPMLSFDVQAEHFLRSTMLYLQTVAETGTSRSTSRRHIIQRFRDSPSQPEGTWTLDTCYRECCEPDMIFFEDMLMSTYFVGLANYAIAGECWRSAFQQIKAAIEDQDPNFLVALTWSVALLDRFGCRDIVTMLQHYVLNLIKLQASKSYPLFAVLDSFAKIDHGTMGWLNKPVLKMVRDRGAVLIKWKTPRFGFRYQDLTSPSTRILENVYAGIGDPLDPEKWMGRWRVAKKPRLRKRRAGNTWHRSRTEGQLDEGRKIGTSERQRDSIASTGEL